MHFARISAILLLVTCHVRTSPVLASPKCTSETASKRIREGDICEITWDEKGCIRQSDVQLNYQKSEISNIDERPVNESWSFIDISITPPYSGQISIGLVINGITSHSELSRCVKICFDQIAIQKNDPITLHVRSLKLPAGDYDLTAIAGFPGDPGSSSIKKDQSNCLGNPRHFEVVTHRRFTVEGVAKHLERRDLTEKECSCSNCIESYHEYFDDSGLLRFYYNVTDTECSNFSVKLLKLINESISTEQECLRLESSDYYTLQMMAPVGRTRYATKVPVDFPNTPTGCYLIRTLKGVFHGFFWLEAKNITQMDTWNTTILITPRNFESSLEVTWLSPDFPFNFTAWSLTLWYVKDSRVRCEGIESERNVIEAIDPDYPVLRTSSYTFGNLSEGFYCVRLSPFDERCPADGCAPRSSRTVRLMGLLKPVSKKSSLSLWVVGILILVGIVIGISFAFFCYTFYRSSFRPNNTYVSVSLINQYHLEPVRVLVIWSKLNAEANPEFEKVVSAFKGLLRTYSNCKVIDYLDFTALDWRERQYLLTNPTEWLHSHLQDTNEKIIFIGSQGIKSKCHNSDKVSSNGVNKHTQNGVHGDTLDDLLFPFVLRYLKESKELSSNYERIFYIRFTGLQSSENEFEDIVPWMRFSIPNHLRNLTLKLRGYSEERSSLFSNPTEKQIKSLQMLIENCQKKNSENQ